MFVLNSRLGLSCATAYRFNRDGLHNLQSSLFRSYGCILPSSLTRVFSRTLGFSPCLPVSVLVRVHSALLEAFLGSPSCDFDSSVIRLPISSRLPDGGFSSRPVYRLRRTLPTVRSHSFLRHSVLIQLCVVSEFSPIVHRILFSSLLRSRLTPDRRALSGKP